MKQETYIDSDGQILYKANRDCWELYHNSKNQLHRLDGPAVEWKDGYYWYKDGKYHRIGGPSIKLQSHLNRPYYEWNVNDKKIEVYYIYG